MRQKGVGYIEKIAERKGKERNSIIIFRLRKNLKVL